MLTVAKDSFTYSAASFFTATAMRFEALAVTNPAMGDQSGTYVKIAAIVMVVALIAIVAVLIAKRKK